MTIIKTNFFEEDDIPTAAQLNQPFVDLATASADIQPENTAQNWITRAHMSPTLACNKLYSFKYEGTGPFATSSTSYVTINNGSASEATLNYAPNKYEILRIEASGLVTDIDCQISYDNTDTGNEGKHNYYAFQLLLTYNDGAGSLTTSLGEWGYSFTTSTGVARYWTTNTGVVSNTGTPLGYQTFQFSTTLQYTGTSGARTYEKISLQTKVYNASNKLKVTRNNIVAVMAMR